MKLYPNVQLGKNVLLEDYVIIGKPPQDKQPESCPPSSVIMRSFGHIP